MGPPPESAYRQETINNRAPISLRSKLFAGLGGMLAVLLLAGGLSLGAIENLASNMELLTRRELNSIDSMLQIGQHASVIDRKVLLHLHEAEPYDAEQLQEELEAIEQYLVVYRANIRSPEDKAAYATVSRSAQALGRALSRLSDAAPGQTMAHYERAILPAISQLRQDITAVRTQSLDALSQDMARAQDRALAVGRSMIFLLIAGTLIGLAFMLMISRTIMRPISELSGYVKQLAQGNLDLVICTGSQDELGQLAKAFNIMAAKLRESKRADHARLDRMSQTTQLAVDSLRDAVVLFDPNLKIEVSNHAAERHFAMVPGRRLKDLQAPWLAELIDESLALAQPYYPRGYENVRQLFISGAERFYLPNIVPVYDDTGELLGITVVLADVTRLRRVDEMKSDMIATVSHELKTPLTSIRMALYLLLEGSGPELSERQRELLETARCDCNRLFNTVDNLLDLSRLQSGRFQLQLEKVDLLQLIEEVLEGFRFSYQTAAIELKQHIPPNLPPVHGDYRRLSIVFSNLLGNALKYCPAGSTVHLRAEAAQEKIKITVADNGPGIPAEATGQIFNRFFRVPGVSGKGAGLGLAISQEIAESHGGSIRCESEAGKGAAFIVELPASQDAP